METTGTVLTAILEVFTSVGTWIAGAVEQITPMFYDEGALTFLGVLAVAGLAISVVFLIIGVIQNFLHFRG
jgi:VIT1/CCC1 family predicted Fe2+/Mn2+ transporter